VRGDHTRTDRGADDGVRAPTDRAGVRAAASVRRGRFLTAGLAPAGLLVGAALVVLGGALIATAPRHGIGLELPLQAAAPVGSAADAAPATASHRSGHDAAPVPASDAPSADDRPSDPTTSPDEALVPPPRIDPAASTQPDPRDGVPPWRDTDAGVGAPEAAPDAPAVEPAAAAEDPAVLGEEPVPEPEPETEPQPEPETEPEPEPEPEPETEPAPAADETSRPGPVALPTRVEITRIGVHSTLIDLHLDARGRLEVPQDPAQAGWWTGGPRPGQDGPAVIVGHVDSVLGPGVFHGLPHLEPGDEIVVHRADDTEARFAVERVERWAKDAFPTDAVYREADGDELRLITCGGRWDQRSLRYLDNVIVFAREVS
jgi:sortase (surface protein transpeptidase)